MKSIVTLTLPGEIRFTRLASQTASNTASLFTSTCNAGAGNWEFSHAFELAVSEAFTNAVNYGDRMQGTRDITITFIIEQQKLTVAIRDTNPPFHAETPEPDIATYPERGYGLMLIRTLMDTLTISRENGENVITMSKQL